MTDKPMTPEERATHWAAVVRRGHSTWVAAVVPEIAAMIRAAEEQEREDCAKACLALDREADKWDCAAAIRARKEPR